MTNKPKKTKNKLLDSSTSIKKFIVTIDCFDNCSSLAVESINNYKVSYEEIIGILEKHKTIFILNQSGVNLNKYGKKD